MPEPLRPEPLVAVIKATIRGGWKSGLGPLLKCEG